MTPASPQDQSGDRPGARAWLAVFGVGLAVRAAAAAVVDRAAQGGGALCLFPDTKAYWQLAGQILEGRPFVVMQYDQPHYALRTPGYPAFLAACRAAFGDATLPPRLVQAALGAGASLLLAGLVRRLVPRDLDSGRWTRNAPLLAAWIAAVEPFHAGTSVLLLTESLFVPLMLAMLWGLACAWDAERPGFKALAAGGLAGLAVLVRPSWSLFVPAVLAWWVAFAADRRAALRGSILVAVGLVLAMAPWWARNARVYGRFVPTAVWAGASLYDGLRPDADGSSDMRFLDRPEIRRLDETAQDRALRAMALDFAREHPGRVLELAAIKAGRFWSPWPNADQFASVPVNLAGAAVTIPLYGLMLAGLYARRRDPRAWALLAGPLLYFAALHLAFVSSIRYRIPAAVPAFGLAAIGLAMLGRRGRSP